MTIRHLIRKAKLHIIQKQYDHLFVFHCSGLTNSQWRQFKHLLYLSRANTLFGASRLPLLPCIHIESTHTTSKLHSSVDLVSFNMNNPMWQSNDIHNGAFHSIKGSEIFSRNDQITTHVPSGSEATRDFQASSQQMLGRDFQASSILSGPTCLLYVTQPFTSSNSDEIDVSANHNKLATSRFKGDVASGHNQNKQKYGLLDISKDIDVRVTWPDLLTQIKVSSYNTSLLLLYGQIQLISMNHMDIQHATHLQNSSVLHSLIPSINDAVQELCLCLSQPFLEFLCHNSVHSTSGAHHNSAD